MLGSPLSPGRASLAWNDSAAGVGLSGRLASATCADVHRGTAHATAHTKIQKGEKCGIRFIELVGCESISKRKPMLENRIKKRFGAELGELETVPTQNPESSEFRRYTSDAAGIALEFQSRKMKKAGTGRPS